MFVTASYIHLGARVLTWKLQGKGQRPGIPLGANLTYAKMYELTAALRSEDAAPPLNGNEQLVRTTVSSQ